MNERVIFSISNTIVDVVAKTRIGPIIYTIMYVIFMPDLVTHDRLFTKLYVSRNSRGHRSTIIHRNIVSNVMIFTC